MKLHYFIVCTQILQILVNQFKSYLVGMYFLMCNLHVTEIV